ncbi:MAG TPA: AraC family transcriptional regulator, partial [Pseudosphingobacterium sp.]|nr:AraC family transcriptional regulator [Pseudosphingobacterium sp.]
DVHGPGFDFFLTGSVWLLLAECIDDAKNREPIIAHVSADNLSRIIASQEILVNNVDKTFPGINVLAAEAYMSATKYKTLFKKITGLSANTFFLNNKLEVAKEMLESGGVTIGEVADRLNFTNAPYLTAQFKAYFGVAPKEYTSKL